MTPDEINKLKEKITNEMKALEKKIRVFEERTKPIPPDDAIGRLTRMEAISAKSVHEASLRASKARLVRLKSALSKIDDSGFGICTMCDEPIPAGRIMLMPETQRCVRCAEAER